jgi:hypothetical protein
MDVEEYRAVSAIRPCDGVADGCAGVDLTDTLRIRTRAFRNEIVAVFNFERPILVPVRGYAKGWCVKFQGIAA